MSFKVLMATFMLILVASISAAYGIDVNVFGRDGDSIGSVNLDLSAADDAAVQSSILVSRAQLDPVISINGIGSINENHQVTDSSGNHAEIHARVISGLNPTYSDSLMPAEGYQRYSTGEVSATQSLTVENARYIMCSQRSSNLKGSEARSSIEIERGSLMNYLGTASATTDGIATTSQSFDSASGKGVIIEEVAFGSSKSVRGRTEIIDGSIDNYHDSSATASPSFASTYHSFEKASGWGIDIESAALRSGEEKSSASTMISGTMNKPDSGSLTDYTGTASSSDDPYTIASQTIASASGKEINVRVGSSYAEDYKCSSNLNVQTGSLKNYADMAYAPLSTTIAQQEILTSASGTAVKLTGHASNADGSKAGSSMSVEGTKSKPGSLSMYRSLAAAKAATATEGLGPTASVLQGSFSGSALASGTTIELKSYARDGSKDKVQAKLHIDNGMLRGYVTNTASANASIKEISASQKAISATGDKIKLHAKASTTNGDKETNTTKALEPDNEAFCNNAIVSSGVPSVD